MPREHSPPARTTIHRLRKRPWLLFLEENDSIIMSYMGGTSLSSPTINRFSPFWDLREDYPHWQLPAFSGGPLG